MLYNILAWNYDDQPTLLYSTLLVLSCDFQFCNKSGEVIGGRVRLQSRIGLESYN
ncbi:hypothetical protein HPY86_08125 [candidate division WOR-3 bacterium]|nr:hypothetical protein [candidate division WOR-3 bacterium]